MAINAIYAGLKSTFPLLNPDFDVHTLLQSSVCINYVPSEINVEADQLAKKGVDRHHMRSYWAREEIKEGPSY